MNLKCFGQIIPIAVQCYWRQTTGMMEATLFPSGVLWWIMDEEKISQCHTVDDF